MAEYPQEYFKGELRGDFFVEEMMKRAWAAQIKVLEEIDMVCKKHNIKWFAAYGTLLGAVRHKGFIPWDDDMDIYMLREDYIKFIKAAKSELPQGYVVLDMTTEEEWEFPFGRVCNSNSIDTGAERMNTYFGCPYVIGVDIYPLDHLPSNEDEKDLIISLVKILMPLTSKEVEINDEYITTLAQLEQMLGIKADRSKNLRREVMKMISKVSQLYNDNINGDLAVVYAYGFDTAREFKASSFSNTVMLPFETTQLPAPVGYDEILTKTFGDYMVPLRSGQDHNYPFYKKQEEQLKKMQQKPQ